VAYKIWRGTSVQLPPRIVSFEDLAPNQGFVL